MLRDDADTWLTDLRSQLEATLGNAYTIERELGGGGMSRVFVATERALSRKVVIKVLPPDMIGAVSVDRFKREISLAARLQQANIVPLLSASDMNGLPYFTMPYVEGESLRARLSAGGELPVNEAIGILKEVARALAYAHEHGVVHRDIKPDNVLISGGTAMVTDFGVAKAVSAATADGAGMTGTGIALGTPAYMAPEQAAGDPSVDFRADIYAFGCLAYELLTGSPPFVGRNAQAMIAAHMTEAPDAVTRRRPSVPAPLAELISRCLEKRAADRPQSATEIVRALDDVSSGARTASAPAAPTPAGWRKTLASTLSAIAVVLVAAGAVLMWRGAHSTEPRSVAVLPFENAGGDSAQEYFSDGMTDDISSALVNDGMRVAPRTSSYFYKGKHATPKDVGSSLGVDAVLTGKVSRLGTRLRVTAELASAHEAVALWSYSDDRDVKDIFAVQHTIADSIISVLRAHLRAAAPKVAARQPENPDAHELVMQGRYQSNLGTPAGIAHAVELFHRALAIDSTNASAYVGLAFALAEVADGVKPPIEVYPEAIKDASRAIELDSTNADAWSTRAGLILEYEWDWPRARHEMDRALALNANDALLHVDESFYQMVHGRRDLMVAPARQALRMDPYNPIVAFTLQWMYMFTGQPDSAIAAAGLLQRIAPGFAYLDAFAGYSLADEKRFTEADSAFRAAEPVIGHRSPGLAWLRATQGRPAEAHAILDEIERDWNKKYVAPELIAWAYLALGDRDRTLTWLEKGVELHSAMGMFNVVWPPFHALKDEPRFRAVLRRLNIPEGVLP